MSLRLIVLLSACLLMAALLYYLIFVRRERMLGSWARSGLVSFVCILIPLLLAALWLQAGARQRLEQAGFVPYPGFSSSSGIATGLGDSPTWVFEIDGDTRAAIEFYARPQNHPGWTLESGTEGQLQFSTAGKAASITASADSLAVTITQVE